MQGLCRVLRLQRLQVWKVQIQDARIFSLVEILVCALNSSPQNPLIKGFACCLGVQYKNLAMLVIH